MKLFFSEFQRRSGFKNFDENDVSFLKKIMTNEKEKKR